MRALVGAFLLSAAAFATSANAQPYTEANFSAGIFGGNANARAPLLDPFFPSDTFSGSFVFDNAFVPAAGSGYVNVAFSSFPDIAAIGNADAFSFNFGPYLFTLANDPTAMIQYNNGQFNGFVFNTTFSFEGQNYLFHLNGGQLIVNSEADPYGQPYINGYLNIGNASLTGAQPYVPNINGGAGPVPEPATWGMMLLGFAAVGVALRRQSRRWIAQAA